MSQVLIRNDYVDSDARSSAAAPSFTETLLPKMVSWHTPALLQSRLAAQLTKKQQPLDREWLGQSAEPSWEGRGEREFSWLRPVD
jgi:hypothetical protein